MCCGPANTSWPPWHETVASGGLRMRLGGGDVKPSRSFPVVSSIQRRELSLHLPCLSSLRGDLCRRLRFPSRLILEIKHNISFCRLCRILRYVLREIVTLSKRWQRTRLVVSVAPASPTLRWDINCGGREIHPSLFTFNWAINRRSGDHRHSLGPSGVCPRCLQEARGSLSDSSIWVPGEPSFLVSPRELRFMGPRRERSLWDGAHCSRFELVSLA